MISKPTAYLLSRSFAAATLVMISASVLNGSFAGAQSVPVPYAPPVPNAALDAAKCTDMKSAQGLLKAEIMKRVREAQSAGYKPSSSYEGSAVDGTMNMTQRVDGRAAQQADVLTRALFAAITNPTTAAAAASDAISGDSRRRGSLQMFARCEHQDISPREIIENQHLLAQSNGTCINGRTPTDMGMNVTQVFQTNMAADKVMVRFARAKLTSTEKDTVSFCLPAAGDPNCRKPENYGPIATPNITPTMNRTYFFEDSIVFKKTVLGISLQAPTPMVNRTVMKISQVDVCGKKAYLVTGFGNGGEAGFDRSSLLGLIAPVGNKTIVIGNLSAQAAKAGSWPISFAESYNKEAMESVFGVNTPGEAPSGYASLAAMIGSTERPVLGELGGSGGFGASQGGGRAVSAQVAQ